MQISKGSALLNHPALGQILPAKGGIFLWPELPQGQRLPGLPSRLRDTGAGLVAHGGVHPPLGLPRGHQQNPGIPQKPQLLPGVFHQKAAQSPAAAVRVGGHRIQIGEPPPPAGAGKPVQPGTHLPLCHQAAAPARIKAGLKKAPHKVLPVAKGQLPQLHQLGYMGILRVYNLHEYPPNSRPSPFPPGKPGGRTAWPCAVPPDPYPPPDPESEPPDAFPEDTGRRPG